MINDLPRYFFDLDDEGVANLYNKEMADRMFWDNTHFRTSDGKLLRLRNSQVFEVYPKRMFGVTTKGNDEQTLAMDDILNDDISLVAITGDAGTGKTFMAVVGSLYTHKNVVFTRETIEVGKELGFLPGEIDEKFKPYTRPFYDTMSVLRGKMDEGAFERLAKRVELVPLQHLRGGTMHNTIMIVDEAQNCTVDTLKMAITRAGKGSKVILSGSFNQIDNKELNMFNCGLTKVIKAFEGQSCFSHIHLIKNERSDLARLAELLL